MPTTLFTKPPLLQESRLNGGGSPNLVDLVERKVPVKREIVAINFANVHLVLYKQLIQTGSVLLLLILSSVLRFPLYEETGNGSIPGHRAHTQCVCLALLYHQVV